MPGDTGDVFRGAGTGAVMGAPLGPWGIAGGAILGGAYGFFAGADEEAAARRKMEALRAEAQNYEGMRPVVQGQRRNVMENALKAYNPANSALATMYGPDFAMGEGMFDNPIGTAHGPLTPPPGFSPAQQSAAGAAAGNAASQASAAQGGRGPIDLMGSAQPGAVMPGGGPQPMPGRGPIDLIGGRRRM